MDGSPGGALRPSRDGKGGNSGNTTANPERCHTSDRTFLCGGAACSGVGGNSLVEGHSGAGYYCQTQTDQNGHLGGDPDAKHSQIKTFLRSMCYAIGIALFTSSQSCSMLGARLRTRTVWLICDHGKTWIIRYVDG